MKKKYEKKIKVCLERSKKLELQGENILMKPEELAREIVETLYNPNWHEKSWLDEQIKHWKKRVKKLNETNPSNK